VNVRVLSCAYDDCSRDSNELHHSFDDMCVNKDTVEAPAGELWLVPLECGSAMYALILAQDAQYIVGINCNN
jgi:hypothetical protein